MTNQNNQSFSKQNPFLQLTWDATSLGTFKECPRKYYLQIVRGYRKKKNAVPLDYGILLHEGLEGFFKREVAGMEWEENVLMTFLQLFQSPVRADLGEGDETRNFRSLIFYTWFYLNKYKNEEVKTVKFPDGTIGAELHFNFETGLKTSQGEMYSIAGHIDRLAESELGIYVHDHKTTASAITPFYFSQYNPDTQMTIYTLAGQIVYNTAIRGVVIDAIKVKGEPEFERQMTMRTKETCDEWLVELEHWLKLAEYFSQVGCYPMNDKSCHKYSGCPFREYCKAPKALRETILRDDFEVKPWDCTVARGGE